MRERDIDHGVRCRAASLILPPGAAITGRSAAYLHGVPLAGHIDPVEVIAPPRERFGPVKGLRIYTGEIGDDEVVYTETCRVTTPERAAIDAVRRLELLEAVVLLDAMAHAGLFTQRDLLARIPCKRPRAFGFTRAKRAIDLMDARAESPQESRLRVQLLETDISPPVVQHTVRNEKGFIARVDLAWPGKRLAVEYDGAWHGEPTQLAKDRQRLNRLLAADCKVIHVTNDMLYGGFAQLTQQLNELLSH